MFAILCWFVLGSSPPHPLQYPHAVSVPTTSLPSPTATASSELLGTTDQNNYDSSSSLLYTGLSGGAIAGIVIGVIVILVVGVIILATVFFLKKNSKFVIINNVFR